MQSWFLHTGSSDWIVFLTGLAGMIANYLWWKADQNRQEYMIKFIDNSKAGNR